MRNRPVASIIIPFKDRKQLLVQTVENLLQQTFSDYEILLIDTGSTDGADNYVKSMASKDSRIAYLDNTEMGGAFEELQYWTAGSTWGFHFSHGLG